MNINHGPKNNLVLIKPRLNNDKIVLNNGGVLYIDTTYEVEKHANIVADVIEVSPTVLLRQGKHYIDEDKQVPVEIMPGDVAYCYYLAILNAIQRKGDGKAIIENGELHLFISYENIFMVIRDGVPIPVNDYVIIEPTYKELKNELSELEKRGLVMPDSIINEKKNFTQFGIIRYAGRNLSPDNGFSDEDLKVGSKVIIQKHADIPLEYELHQTFEKGRRLFRVKRSDVLMVMED